MEIIDGKIIFKSQKEYLKFQKEANHENNYTGEIKRPWIENDIEIILKYLGESQQRCILSKNSKILSLGTRDFYDLNLLRNRGFLNLTGFDIDSRSKELSKKYNFEFILGDIHSYRFTKKYDLIYSRHMLEHCHTPEKALKNIQSALSEFGIISIVVPIDTIIEGVSQSEISIKKRRGHCSFWKNTDEFEGLCSKYFKTIKCFEDIIPRKKIQMMFLGKQL